MTEPTNDGPTPETDAIMDNIRVAIDADTREQSIMHREEAARCIEALERQRDEARKERDEAIAHGARIASMMIDRVSQMPSEEGCVSVNSVLSELCKVANERGCACGDDSLWFSGKEWQGLLMSSERLTERLRRMVRIALGWRRARQRTMLCAGRLIACMLWCRHRLTLIALRYRRERAAETARAAAAEAELADERSRGRVMNAANDALQDAMMDAMERADKAVAELAAIRDRWIPVAERLPVQPGQILATNGDWIWATLGLRGDMQHGVTHWRPMPEPPSQAHAAPSADSTPKPA